MTLRIAIAGVGKIARDQHVPAILGSDAFDLVATASPEGSVAGVPSFPDIATLLAEGPEVDAVSICTPPSVRYGVARAAIEAGKHVFLEKPPGATLSEVEDLIALAAGQGVTLLASWHSRHAEAVDAARDWLRDRRIAMVEVIWKEDVRRWHPGQEWIWKAGGLGVFDPGINALSVLTKVFPRMLHLTGAELAFPANCETPIAAALAFFDPGGAQVSAEFDWRQEGEQTWDIRIETVGMSALLSKGGAEFHVDGERIVAGPDREYPDLYAHFAGLIARGASDTDVSPMRLVADAFTLGRRFEVARFDW